MKAVVKSYCNEGLDILTARDLQTAPKKRPVRGTTAGVFCMNDKNITMKLKEIPNFSTMYNFEFTPGGFRMWKAFKIGTGRLIAWNEFIFSHIQSSRSYLPQRKTPLRNARRVLMHEIIKLRNASFKQLFW